MNDLELARHVSPENRLSPFVSGRPRLIGHPANPANGPALAVRRVGSVDPRLGGERVGEERAM
jgi:hypothetical protein